MARLTKEQKEALRDETILGTDISDTNAEGVRGGDSNEEPVVDSMYDMLQALLSRVEILEKQMTKPVAPSINKIEAHTGEAATPIEGYSGFKMGESDKIQSMRNAIAILPPNMIKNGRHSSENIQAICGFKVSEEMMDAAYKGLK